MGREWFSLTKHSLEQTPQESLAELQRRIRRIEIRSRRKATELFSGEYHSSFKGKGIEFSHVREYHYGDDVRSIDWNTSARNQDLYVKLFTEERERSLLLMVDGSASMFFGSNQQSKKELAFELAAVLAFSALDNNDKVGLLIFTDQVELYLPPRKGRRHVLLLLDKLSRHKPQSKQTNINAALSFLRYTLRRQEIVFLITDLIDSDYEKGMKQLNQRHDFILVHLRDALDTKLPLSGLLTLQDPESGERCVVDMATPQQCERYKAMQERSIEELRQRMRRMRIDAIYLETDHSFFGALNAFFRYREQKV
uniref:von Willebrand factor, type A n=1 Tax=Chlorobium chlorochromatii (strain CaD3) TaxID=340177 RepID=Q3AUD5_CHLCH